MFIRLCLIVALVDLVPINIVVHIGLGLPIASLGQLLGIVDHRPSFCGVVRVFVVDCMLVGNPLMELIL